MKSIALVSALLFLAGSPAFAGNWSGYLVDSKCYQIEQDNKNPTDTMTDVDRDKGLEVELCTPNAKTKSFAIVQRNGGATLDLDSAGNAKAAELVEKFGKKSFFSVDIKGERSRNTVKVASISVNK